MRTDTRTTLWSLLPPMSLCALALAVLILGDNGTLFVLLRQALLPLGPVLWSTFTLLGDALVAPLLIIPFLRGRPGLIWEGTLAALLATLFTHGLKPLVHMPRPAGVIDGLQVIGPRLLAGSFPSGHTASAFTLAALLLLSGRLGLPGAVVALLLASLVGLSRVVVGAHWPADVLAGAAGGWCCAALALALARRWTWGARPAMLRLQRLLLLGIALLDLVGHATGYPDGMWLQRGLALAGALWLAWRMATPAPTPLAGPPRHPAADPD